MCGFLNITFDTRTSKKAHYSSKKKHVIITLFYDISISTTG